MDRKENSELPGYSFIRLIIKADITHTRPIRSSSNSFEYNPYPRIPKGKM
ncbi:MAG: hypothetical protein M1424_00220 [Candidatus Thermoplasmatota archaeon]|jgi:hypothetical protein|nr:hypothetical protein [Candidatus Thermoplasmatota archaeon]